MNIIDPIIMEVQHEVGITRPMLEIVPEDRFGWKPHEKSMPMGALASHLVDIMGWTMPVLEQDELVMNPGEFESFDAKNRAELLAAWDEKSKTALAAMQGRSNESLFKTWRMKMGDQTVIEMPRLAVLRGFIISHLIHHRGQLSVYLRMNDVSLPQIYGPTADNKDMAPV